MLDPQLTVLVVDDSVDMLEILRRNLNDLGLNPIVCSGVVEAIDILESTKIDLVITDLHMPKIDGRQLVKYISQHFNITPVLVVTGYPDVRAAVDVMKLGALEYLIKPFTNDELKEAIENVLGNKIQEITTAISTEKLSSFHGIIGVSDVMQKLYQTIERTKNNKATVLITGESGTGKEMVARAIHYNSNFSSAPFVPVNCGAIPDQLLESELFGHIKGSFTGAFTTRAGFFQAANTGTLFLDEISNASLTVQAKLLRAIQDKEITMLGATKSQQIDVRIITASNSNLLEMIDKQMFREDLYYRLNVVTVEIPPLRDRREDIPHLFDYFNKKYSNEQKKAVLKISKPLLKILIDYAWPGNVRELENFVYRLVIMTDKKITIEDIPNHMKMQSPTNEIPDTMMTLADMEKRYIQKVLNATGNNKTKAAQILNIDRKTLREKLK